MTSLGDCGLQALVEVSGRIAGRTGGRLGRSTGAPGIWGKRYEVTGSLLAVGRLSAGRRRAPWDCSALIVTSSEVFLCSRSESSEITMPSCSLPAKIGERGVAKTGERGSLGARETVLALERPLVEESVASG